MKDTGRIKHPPTDTARRILFEGTAASQIEHDLPHVTTVDRAHVVMLAERGVVRAAQACRLLKAIDELRDSQFAPLLGRVPHRGVYLMYEDYLIETLGIETAGILQTGRSRNDLGATVFKIRMRRHYARLMREALRLQAVLLARARRNASVVMPAYTHGQVAMPITYGHYLAAVAQALSRDLDGFDSAVQDIHSCPLGAGAIAGTTLPIDTDRTSRLLGFRQAVTNSIDAVASRDLALRILGACAVYSVTLSRLAADLFQWATAEFGFINLPDQLCGSSSAMPQKRNPFLLEHVLGRTASTAAGFLSSLMAMHATPFTNNIAVGTEAVRAFWDTMRSAQESTILTRLVVSGASPNSEAMRRRAEMGYSGATELANRLVLRAGLDFRTAHRIVGEIVLSAIADGNRPLDDAARDYLAKRGILLDLDRMDAPSLAAAACAGGGPAAESLKRCIQATHAKWTAQARELRRLTEWWAKCEARLERAVEELQGMAETG